MINIAATIGKEPYMVEIKSPSGNTVIADEPNGSGGRNKGFAPKELLASSLAACTCITLRMYADHKGWNLEKVNVEIELVETDGQTTFNRKLHVAGNLDDKQRTRLLGIANACPLHKILTGQIIINTQFV